MKARRLPEAARDLVEEPTEQAVGNRGFVSQEGFLGQTELIELDHELALTRIAQQRPDQV